MFHLAGLGGMRSSWGAEFAEYTRCNVLATQRLAQACVEERVPRLVVASSSSVYGEHEPGPCGEDDLPKPASPYGVSKLAAEQLCLAYARHPRSATSVVALRFFTVFGPRQRDDMLIGRVLRAAADGPPSSRSTATGGSGEILATWTTSSTRPSPPLRRPRSPR